MARPGLAEALAGSARAPETPAALRSSPSTLSGAFRALSRHASPRILLALSIAALGARAAAGDFSRGDLAVVAAVVALWPLQEWLIHVLILHFRPRTLAGRTLDFAVPKKHRAHHRDPWDLDILLIPTQAYLYSPLLVAALAWLATPDLPRMLTALAVYFPLALRYEATHFLIHTAYPPRGAFYRRLHRNHLLHHFKNEHYWFGVSMLGADRVLRTAPDPERVQTSTTVRTLGVGAAG
jgi:hypothetical protein